MRSERTLRACIQGEVQSISVIFSSRQSLALHVYPDRRIEARVPKRYPIKAIRQFIDDKAGWIVQKLIDFEALPVVSEPGYRNGNLHSYLGRVRILCVLKGRPASCDLHDGVLLLQLQAPEDEKKARRLLEQWYRERAVQLFPEMLTQLMQNTSFSSLQKPPLRIRKMKARWGSCSRDGRLCLNSLLVKQQPEAIRYVINHELCHLIEFNHGPAFYALLDQAMPDWRDVKRLLDLA